MDELQKAIVAYQAKWLSVVHKRKNKDFFEQLIPTSVAWKTEDIDDFNARFLQLRELSDQVHLGWVNDRWLATFHLRKTTLAEGLTIVKLMQRRNGSTDAVGLDHIDFYFDPAVYTAKEVLVAESDLTWNEEMNGEHCRWLSIWFEGTEAKLRSDTVLDVCIDEMKDVRNQIVARGDKVAGKR